MKRIILIVSILLITISCYIFMNRNYDPLARYPYESKHARELIIKYLDEREIKYIIDYSISPDEFVKYIDSPDFTAYHINQYNYAYKILTNLTPAQLVTIVEKINRKDLDIDYAISLLQYKDFEDMLINIDRGL